jgi:hypothetical protein
MHECSSTKTHTTAAYHSVYQVPLQESEQCIITCITDSPGGPSNRINPPFRTPVVNNTEAPNDKDSCLSAQSPLPSTLQHSSESSRSNGRDTSIFDHDSCHFPQDPPEADLSPPEPISINFVRRLWGRTRSLLDRTLRIEAGIKSFRSSPL